MGFWSTNLYGNDLALDVKAKLDSILKEEITKELVYKKMLNCFSELLLTDEEPLFWLALADRMWDYGLLIEEVKQKALAYIYDYIYLDAFETYSEKRSWQKTLNKLKEKLESNSQGKRKIVIELPFKRNIWNIGDYYAYEFHKSYSKELGLNSHFIIIQKIGESYYGDSLIEYNIIQVFNKIFKQIPLLEDLNNLHILPLDVKDDFYDSPNITKNQKHIMNENINNSLQGDLHYNKINEYNEKYFHYIGNNCKNIPKVKTKNNSYFELKTLEKDLCEYFISWNHNYKSKLN